MVNGDRIPGSRTGDKQTLREVEYDDGRISFRSNPCDPGGYDVVMRHGSFYLPSRVLPDLTRKDVATRDAISSLENFYPDIRGLLKINDIGQDEFYIAMLKVRNLELEDMLNTTLSKQRL